MRSERELAIFSFALSRSLLTHVLRIHARGDFCAHECSFRSATLEQKERLLIVYLYFGVLTILEPEADYVIALRRENDKCNAFLRNQPILLTKELKSLPLYVTCVRVLIRLLGNSMIQRPILFSILFFLFYSPNYIK